MHSWRLARLSRVLLLCRLFGATHALFCSFVSAVARYGTRRRRLCLQVHFRQVEVLSLTAAVCVTRANAKYVLGNRWPLKVSSVLTDRASSFCKCVVFPGFSLDTHCLPRCLKSAGKKHITPVYERDTTRGTISAEGRLAQAEGSLWAPPGTPLHYRAPPEEQETAQNFVGVRAPASSGPGSFLKGLGRKMAESGAGVGNG